VRTSIKVDQKLLCSAIEEAERDGPLGNLSELWKAAAIIYNNGAGERSDLPEISFSVVASRAAQWKLAVKTKAGRRGLGAMSEEHKAAMQAARSAGRTSKSEKFSSNSAIQESHLELERCTTQAAKSLGQRADRWQPLVERIKQGSRSAAVKLMCLECSSYQTAEVRKCVCIQCPLWAFRPFQGAIESDEDVEVVEEVVAEEAVA